MNAQICSNDFLITRIFICRILNDDDISKDNAPGTPTDHQHVLLSPSYDSTSLANGNFLSSGKSSKLATAFSKRTNRLAVKFNINNMPNIDSTKKEPDHEIDEDDIVSKVRPRQRCSLEVHPSGPRPDCRFMYDRTEDRVRSI